MHHDSGDGTQEDGVGREVRCEAVAILEQVPGEHTDTDYGGDVASAADVLRGRSGQGISNSTSGGHRKEAYNEARAESCEVTACADRVG